MTVSEEAINALTTAVERLLTARDNEGQSVIDIEGLDAFDEVHTCCRICGEVDGHERDCVVRIAEYAIVEVRRQ